MEKGFTVIELLVVIAVVLLVLMLCYPLFIGAGGAGPTNTVECTVNRLYVDSAGKDASHYMVGTDQGVFEVDNGFLLGMWNADEVYSSIQESKRYRFETEGNKHIGWFFQYYPYITKVTPLSDSPPLEAK